jgi:drug/metabolite transporter (DMT)-like permease
MGPYRYRSVPALASGIVGVSLGGIFLIAGAIVASTGGCDEFGDCTSTNWGAVAGLTVGGIIGIGVGIPLIIYGAKRVPAGMPAAEIVDHVLPAWAGAPHGNGWRWTF